jgi:hypothetical protein
MPSLTAYKSNMTSDSSPTAAAALASHHPLCAEILSYIVHDTRDLARLRLISHNWNQKVLPFVLKSARFILNCYPNTDFIDELVAIRDIPSPSHWVGLDELHVPDNGSDGVSSTRTCTVFKEGGAGSIQSIMTMDFDSMEDDLKTTDDGALNFAAQAKTLCQTRSLSEFEKVLKEALSSGMFFSVQEFDQQKNKYEHGLGMDTKLGYCNIFAAIITQHISRNLYQCNVDRSGNSPIVLFHGTGEQDLIIPFDISGTYRGYVTEESEDGITCIIPLIMGLDHYLMDELIGTHSSDVLALTSIWSSTQERILVPEGIALADSILPESLHQSLMQQIDGLADRTETDYSHSNGIVRDLVHPALYAYVKGVYTLVQRPPLVAIFAQDIIDQSAQADPSRGPTTDYWGREYEASTKYQWLPTYFDIGADGTCTIEDYINNLVPRPQYEPLYKNLAQLFSHALPLIESVFSYARVVRSRIRHTTDADEAGRLG